MTTETNQDQVKAAAKRMCALLATHGHTIKHSVMLEALATGLGLDNWRTLKAVIDSPRQLVAPVVSPQPALYVPGSPAFWTVDAVYRDNNQPFGQDYQGRTAMEAGIACLVERQTDFGLEMGIFKVTGPGEGFYPYSLDALDLMAPQEALRVLHKELMAVQQTKGLQPELRKPLAWLSLLTTPAFGKGVNELTDWESYNKAQSTRATSYLEGEVATPSQVLRQLCDVVTAQFSSVVEMERANEQGARAVYQVVAMCDFLEDVLNDPHCSAIVDMGLDDIQPHLS